MPLRVSLVNLQKLTFHAWRRRAQHVDVGAGAEHALRELLVRTTQATSGCSKRMFCRMLYSSDVDTEIVRIKLELVARSQPGVLVDVHGQGGDAAVDGQPPMR